MSNKDAAQTYDTVAATSTAKFASEIATHWNIVKRRALAHELAGVYGPAFVPGRAHQMLHDALAREIGAGDKPHRRSKTGRR